MKRILIFIVLAVPTFATAANHYILQGAAGNGSGSDWTNACTGFSGSCAPDSLVRGDTYYVGTGSYSPPTLNTATSGTLIITIKGATVADHGTASGWSNTYSVSAADGGRSAIWTGTIAITTSYWIFDGSVGPVWDTTPVNYGFSFGTSLSQAFTLGSAGSVSNNGPAITSIVLSHIYGRATTSDVEKEFLEGATSGGAHTNVTMSHLLLDGWQGLFMTKGQSGTPYSNWVIEYNVLLNGSSTNNNHGEWINPNERPLSNATIRFNWFKGYSGGAGMTGTIVANNSDNDNAAIYGNVFDGLRVGNGVITGTSQGNLNNAVVYNNSFLNMTSDSGNAIGGTGQGSGNVAYNNVFYNMNASAGGGFTLDYNSYFSTTNAPSEPHVQKGSSNPFVNSTSGDYSLTSDTVAWTPLSVPYNVDPTGVLRTSSRGAYQFSTSSGGVVPKPPSSLAAIVQ
jgi:hypothetical protein